MVPNSNVAESARTSLVQKVDVEDQIEVDWVRKVRHVAASDATSGAGLGDSAHITTFAIRPILLLPPCYIQIVIYQADDIFRGCTSMTSRGVGGGFEINRDFLEELIFSWNNPISLKCLDF